MPISAVLMQKDSEGRFVPGAYESCKLTGPEMSFNQCERECLAAFWGVEKFESLTEMAPIIIQTHHSPLKYILSGKLAGSNIANTQIAQWVLFLTG